MNNARRKELDKVINMLNKAKDTLESALCDEQDCFDNLPENLQCSMKAQDMEDAINNMEDAMDIIDEVIECIENAQI